MDLLKQKLYFITAFLLITLANVYITSVLSLSPAYIGIILALSSLFLFKISETIRITRRTRELFASAFLLFLYLCIDCIVTRNLNFIMYYVSYFLFNHFIFIIAVYYIQRCNIVQIKKIVKYYFVFSAIIFIIDFFWRIKYSTNHFTGLSAFYNIKFNDLMFPDSNWPGFMSMLLFSLAIYLNDNKFSIPKRTRFVLFFLVVQTFSRVAIVCCIIVLLFSCFMKSKKKNKIYILLFGLPVFLAVVILFLSRLTDSSFLSKLIILKGMFYYITHYDFATLFWGNYPNACQDAGTFLNTWIAGHLYMTRYIDFGFLGCLCEVLFLTVICAYTRFKALYLIIPFFIAGLSFCPWNVPYFYMELAIIYVLENRLYKQSFESGNCSSVS